jgi:hypothetical protein
MKRGGCLTDAPPRIAQKQIDIETAEEPVNRASTRSRLVLVTGLGLAVAAAPPSQAAGDFYGAGRPRTVRTSRPRTVSFAPLFDAYAMFRVKESVQLRFRARGALSGIPIRSEDISFSLQHGANGASRELPMKAVKKGVFEVPFTPEMPGQYWVTASIRGAPAGSVPAVLLGAVGLAEDREQGRRRRRDLRS